MILIIALITLLEVLDPSISYLELAFGRYGWGGGLITPLDLAPMFQIGLMIIDGTLHYYRYRVIYHSKRLARANGFSTVIRFKIFYDYMVYMISGFKSSFIGI